MSITKADQEKANTIIAEFNEIIFGKKSKVRFYAIYKGQFLYLNRIDGKFDEPVARLKFTGNISNWEFAIYKWSRENYDAEDWLFPVSGHLDGTIEGAMKAGNEAYPPRNSCIQKPDFLRFLNSFFANK